MDDSPVEEYRNKMLDWSLPLSQYSHQCQACFAPQSSSELDIVENTEQGRQANQCRYPRPERRYSVFRNHGTVAPEYSLIYKEIHNSLVFTYRAVFLSGQTKQPLIRACFQAHQTKGGISLWHFSTVQSVFFRLL